MRVIAETQSGSGQRLTPPVECLCGASCVFERELFLAENLRRGHIFGAERTGVVRRLVYRRRELLPSGAHGSSFQATSGQHPMELGGRAAVKPSDFEFREAQFANKRQRVREILGSLA